MNPAAADTWVAGAHWPVTGSDRGHREEQGRGRVDHPGNSDSFAEAVHCAAGDIHQETPSTRVEVEGGPGRDDGPARGSA